MQSNPPIGGMSRLKLRRYEQVADMVIRTAYEEGRIQGTRDAAEIWAKQRAELTALIGGQESDINFLKQHIRELEYQVTILKGRLHPIPKREDIVAPPPPAPEQQPPHVSMGIPIGDLYRRLLAPLKLREEHHEEKGKT